MDMHFETRSSLRDLLNVLFKRKAQILFVFTTVFGLVAVVTFVLQPVYEATSHILVKIGRENVYVPTVPSGDGSPVVSVLREEQINSEIEILKSRTLSEEVLKTLDPKAVYKELKNDGASIFRDLLSGFKTDLSPMDKAVLRFTKDLEVEAVKKSNVMRVSYRSKNPIVAATVVNTLVEFYLDRHLEVFKNPKSTAFFDEQVKLLKEKLNRTEERLRVFKEKHHLTSLSEQKTLQLKEVSDLRTALNQTVSTAAETQRRLDQLRLQLPKVPKTIVQGNEIDHNPYILSTLQARLVELELKRKELVTKYSDENHLVRNINEDIAMVRRTLQDQEKKMYGKSRSGLNPTYQRVEEDLLRNEVELKALLAKQSAQTDQLAEHQDQLQKLNNLEMQLSQLERDAEVDRQNYKLYQTKLEESRIFDAMDSEKIANVSLIEPARTPLKPTKPDIVLNLIIGLLLGALGGVGLACLREYLDDALETPEQVEKTLQLPVLTSVPQFLSPAIKI
jgi:polysaccharide biosynthesis protein PslE